MIIPEKVDIFSWQSVQYSLIYYALKRHISEPKRDQRSVVQKPDETEREFVTDYYRAIC